MQQKWLGVVALLALGQAGACEQRGGEQPEAAVSAETAPTWLDADWQVLEAKVRWGRAAGLDTLPPGTALARLGETFVGTTYTPATLEVPGPERVVVNLRELDCVTFIENVLALVRFIRNDGTALLADRAAAEARYEGYLRDVRYRSGRLDGYASRLHYFSEWLSDNAARGYLSVITRSLGGVEDTEPITFMTGHRASYRQLADDSVFATIAAIEQALPRSRWFIPQAGIARAASGIQDGDIIAATSTLEGLDVAHTGLALHVGGRLHLLHAPLVGKTVEISAVPLAERIAGIRSQDGIMVARVSAALR